MREIEAARKRIADLETALLRRGRDTLTAVLRIEAFREVTEATIRSTDERTFPVQVDGDYIGDFEELELTVEPRALLAVA